MRYKINTHKLDGVEFSNRSNAYALHMNFIKDKKVILDLDYKKIDREIKAI